MGTRITSIPRPRSLNAMRQPMELMMDVITGESIIAPMLLPAKVMLIALLRSFTNHRVSTTAIGTVVQNALPVPMTSASM